MWEPCSLVLYSPFFTQYVKWHIRDNKTLDLLNANLKEGYTSSPLPLLGENCAFQEGTEFSQQQPLGELWDLNSTEGAKAGNK